ncbi:hypothetical protein BYT27DRAFT_7075854, partial [Phlegmacium glaucopus]
MTPYEAAFSKKPDLGEVREWGEKVWVRIEGGDKLGRHVREGKWLGLDEKSKGVQVYWPDTKTVSVERNVYTDNTLASASRIKGENNEGFVEANPDLHVSPKIPQPDSAQSLPIQSPVSNDQAPHNLNTNLENLPNDPIERPKRVRKPTQKVKDLMEGVAVSSNLPKSQTKLAPGVQLPTEPPQEHDILPVEEPSTVLEGEGLSDWMMVADFTDEYALAAETSATEALEPRNLAEAKSRPDW